MKSKLLAQIALFFVLTMPLLGSDAVSFKDYKKLPESERQKMGDDASPELQRQYYRWDQILSLGGKWWEPSHQGRAFIKAKGLFLSYFFDFIRRSQRNQKWQQPDDMPSFVPAGLERIRRGSPRMTFTFSLQKSFAAHTQTLHGKCLISSKEGTISHEKLLHDS